MAEFNYLGATQASSFEESSMGLMALEKAHELFDVCDVEHKGFIIKRDMQRLQDDLPGLTPDQLEEVFDSLDQDKNGFLTSEEFVRGFGAFVSSVTIKINDTGRFYLCYFTSYLSSTCTFALPL
jgi:hypothetical protein